MKKLALDLDGLAVESFDTAPAPGRRGTVHARSGTTYADESCNGTADGFGRSSVQTRISLPASTPSRAINSYPCGNAKKRCCRSLNISPSPGGR